MISTKQTKNATQKMWCFQMWKFICQFCNCICTWDWLVHFRNSCKYISILWSLPWPLLPPVSSAVLLSEMMRIDLTWTLSHIIIILFCNNLRKSKCAMKCENMWFSIFIGLNTFTHCCRGLRIFYNKFWIWIRRWDKYDQWTAIT